MMPGPPEPAVSEARPAAGAAPSPGVPGMAGRLANLVLGEDGRQRRFLRVLFTSGLVYAVSIALMAFGSSRGLFPPRPVLILSAAMIATVLVFYTIFRCSLNLRFVDRALTVPQCLAAQTLIAGAYAVTGPAHASTLVLFPMVSIFGMFDLNLRHGRFINAYTVTIVGAIMLWRTRTMPALYDGDVELIYFLLLSVSMFALTQVASQLTLMRGKLKTQKAALQEALAHIQQMATHDDLTGLANRRHVLTLMEEHALRHARGGPAFYVAIADLDFFKRINDSHGHGVGDEALCTFARQAKAQLRTTDVIGRWGGEEFLVLLPETPPGDPNVGLERLRRALAETAASVSVPELRVAFSAGLSRYRDGEAVGDTVDRADRALYAAKAAGRNRTVAL